MISFPLIKNKLKKRISHNPFLTIWTSRLTSLLFGIQSFRHRLLNFNHCFIDKNVKVTGWSNTKIGLNSVIAEGTWLNINDRRKTDPTLLIGENCFIGRNNFVTVGKTITFGDYCLTATNCAFIGSSHNIDNYTTPYISTGVDTDSSIIIGANCFFGYGTMVLGNVSIGYGCVIGAGTVVLKDIPPLSLVIGNPGRIIKRYSPNKHCWIEVEDYTEEELLSEEKYIALLKKSVRYPLLPISAARSSFGDI